MEPLQSRSRWPATYRVVLADSNGEGVCPPCKEKTEVIQAQPDDSTYEELMRELAFERMIERGLDNFRWGEIISNEEMGCRMRTWQK